MYLLGHPAYSQRGPNRCDDVANPHLAVMKLIARGAAPADARRAVHQARDGHHATVDIFPEGVCEVIYVDR